MMRVLVCDDDPIARFVVKRTLMQGPAAAVIECADGVDALGLITADRFDLLILDLQMPRMGGLEVLGVIRRSPEFKDLPVVVLSTERDEAVILQAIKIGIQGYVLKPVRPDRLVVTVSGIQPAVAAKSAARR